MTDIDAMLIDATRQLAQPRPAPPHPDQPPISQPQSNLPQTGQPLSEPPQPNPPQPNPPQPNAPQPNPPQPNPSQPNPSQPNPSRPNPPRPNPPRPNPPQPNPQPPRTAPRSHNTPPTNGPQPNAGRGATNQRSDAMDIDGDADDEFDFENFAGGENGNGADAQLQMFRMMSRIMRQQKAIMTQNTQKGNASDPETSERSRKRPRPSPPKPRETVNWDQEVPCTLPAGRDSREDRRNTLLAMVRKVIAELIGHVDKTKPRPPSPPTNVKFPTVNAFYIRWEETEKSMFNRLAAGIAVDHILENNEDANFTEAETADLPAMVAEHIRYLCREVRKANRPGAREQKKADLKRAGAQSRRQTSNAWTFELYECRLKVIDRFPTSLGKHRNFIVQLGLEGTSSDEEDPTNRKTYLVRRRPELSSKVQILKAKLDLLYALFFKGPGTRGSQLHIREMSDKVSTRRYVPHGLPVSCLSRPWYNQLEEPEREFYGFADYEYDFTFPDALLARKVGRTPDQIPGSESEEL
ncbi:hypothetical protein FRC09_012908 [Ceratobasidium sp. 395]|nr:hypothetical protein FRC09_012908 [Ceratobasidium sp. 395]